MSDDTQRPDSSASALVPETDGPITQRIIARIEAELRAVPGVTAATVVATGGNIATTVRGGTDQDICDALLASVPCGIGTSGDIHGTATDSEGTRQPLRFSRSFDS